MLFRSGGGQFFPVARSALHPKSWQAAAPVSGSLLSRLPDAVVQTILRIAHNPRWRPSFAGGKNILPMAHLREIATSLGYKSVQTYIQSGNLVFELSQFAAKLTNELASAIEAEFGFSVSTIVLTGPELTEAVEKNPWSNEELEALHFGVLSQNPTQNSLIKNL
mgnify:CR=1 FL=1